MLIEKEALLEKLKELGWLEDTSLEDIVNEIPAVDSVSIVYGELVKRLRYDVKDWNAEKYIKVDLTESANAIEKLEKENERLLENLKNQDDTALEAIQKLRAELAELKQVKRERDALEADFKELARTCVYEDCSFSVCHYCEKNDVCENDCDFVHRGVKEK